MSHSWWGELHGSSSKSAPQTRVLSTELNNSEMGNCEPSHLIGKSSFKGILHPSPCKWPWIFTGMCAKSLQLLLTLHDPPGSSVQGILQARILEWVVMPSSRGSFRPKDRTHISMSPALAGGFYTTSVCNFGCCWMVSSTPPKHIHLTPKTWSPTLFSVFKMCSEHDMNA